MIALAVDNNPTELKVLCEAIHELHPELEIVRFIDPLLALKYSISNKVDWLYASVIMKRLSGFKLEKLIREDNPNLISNFIADDDAYKDKAISRMAYSYTIRPITAERLKLAEAEEW